MRARAHDVVLGVEQQHHAAERRERRRDGEPGRLEVRARGRRRVGIIGAHAQSLRERARKASARSRLAPPCATFHPVRHDPQTVRDGVARALAARLDEVYGEELVSVVLFGSVARGTAHATSDIDLLIVFRTLPHGHEPRFRRFWDALGPIELERRRLAAIGTCFDWSPHPHDRRRGASSQPPLPRHGRRRRAARRS
ncbi:MAG: nucleotidyltransferase domain-containing protein [Deltaproteobacteria bacterium]|nr:nucleotidyltransferase domain-containing protein [Deltaproteobacteria bacterium]